MTFYTNIYKKQNQDGTFTYTTNTGATLIARSKRNYEYAAPNGQYFGTMKTCLAGLRRIQNGWMESLKYYTKYFPTRADRYGDKKAAEDIARAQRNYEEAMSAKVIKIETK